MKPIALLFLVSFVGFLPVRSLAQNTGNRPKIGVVLSGGGAKGLAHIGVLKEIEKAGIHIDYIGGTSMGAIVGGLYASGYTANQLDSIFRSVDSDALVQDYIPRGNKTFYEKNNDEVYALTLPFQNLRLSIPKALSKGMYNYNLISRLTGHVRYVTNFNDLKIPFVCVATDIETGEEKVFHEGNLPLVIKASGAFPSLFSPVEIDGHLYVDGGVANNYPVEEVKKMGADIIIGVDVQDDLKTREQLKGVTNVLVQISNFDMINRMKSKRLLTDVYIKPDISGFSVISFDEGTAIIKKGEEAALPFKAQLEALGTGYFPKDAGVKYKDSLHISGIEIVGNDNYTRSYVLGKLRIKPDVKRTYEDLNNGINNLNATQNFSSINYKVVQDQDKDFIYVTVKENPIRTYLKLGIHYDDLFKSAALLNVTKKNALFKNDLISADFILGDNFRYTIDYYIDNGFHWSFGVKSKFQQFEKDSKTDFAGSSHLNSLGIESLPIKYRSIVNETYIQTIFAQKFLIGTGLEHRYQQIESNALAAQQSFIDKSNYISLMGFIKYDSFSNKYFPKHGWYFFGDFQSVLYSSDFKDDFNKLSIFKADMAVVQTFYNKFSLKLQTEGGFTIGESLNHTFDFVLGGYGFQKFNGFKPFYGYDFLDLSGDSYVKGSAALDYEFVKKNHLNFTANYSNIGNKIFDANQWFKRPNYSGYSFGYGMETLIGPIEIKHSWSPETNKHYTWFTVGFWF